MRRLSPELKVIKEWPASGPSAARTHPFITRLRHYVELSDAELLCLWRLVDTHISVKKRRELVIDGYEYRKLCFVEEGFAARYKLLQNGRRQIVNFVLPGDVIGLPGSFLEKARYSVVAATDLKVHCCSTSEYVQLCFEQPKFGLALSWLAMHETVMCCEHTISTGRRTPIERLAHFLLETHWRLQSVGRAGKGGFTLPLSQEIISDALGLSVPHLNRTLSKLRAEGLVALNGHDVEFLDERALEQLGRFQPLTLVRIPTISH